MKYLLKEKHPALQLPSGHPCKSNQSSLYSHLFNAHDALEDATALHKIIFKSCVIDGREHCWMWAIVFQSQRLVHEVEHKGIDGNPEYASHSVYIEGASCNQNKADSCCHRKSFSENNYALRRITASVVYTGNSWICFMNKCSLTVILSSPSVLDCLRFLKISHVKIWFFFSTQTFVN